MKTRTYTGNLYYLSNGSNANLTVPSDYAEAILEQAKAHKDITIPGDGQETVIPFEALTGIMLSCAITDTEAPTDAVCG